MPEGMVGAFVRAVQPKKHPCISIMPEGTSETYFKLVHPLKQFFILLTLLGILRTLTRLVQLRKDVSVRPSTSFGNSSATFLAG